MNIKRATHSQLSTTESKKQTKQPEQEQNHRYGDYLEGYQLGGESERMREKVQGIRSINSRYKIDRGGLKIVWEMEKPKILYMDMN